GSGFDPEMLAKPCGDLLLLLDESQGRFGIINIVSGGGIPIHGILAVVERRQEGHSRRTLFGASPQEVFLLVWELIEQDPGDGLDNRRLAGTVRPAYRGDTAFELEGRVDMVFDIFEFDPCNQHSRSYSSAFICREDRS